MFDGEISYNPLESWDHDFLFALILWLFSWLTIIAFTHALAWVFNRYISTEESPRFPRGLLILLVVFPFLPALGLSFFFTVFMAPILSLGIMLELLNNTLIVRFLSLIILFVIYLTYFKNRLMLVGYKLVKQPLDKLIDYEFAHSKHIKKDRVDFATTWRNSVAVKYVYRVLWLGLNLGLVLLTIAFMVYWI